MGDVWRELHSRGPAGRHRAYRRSFSGGIRSRGGDAAQAAVLTELFGPNSIHHTWRGGRTSPTTAPACQVYRHRAAGLVRSQWPRRSLGSGVPKLARTSRGLRCSSEVVVPDGGLSYLRKRADCRHRQLPARAARTTCRGQPVDLLLPTSR